MSSHRRRVKHFARASGPRRALLRGLVTSVIREGRIKTTVDRAKETKRHVEKAVTLAKKGDLSSRRLLLSRYPDETAVRTLMGDLAGRFKDRDGGYMRVIRLGARPGDQAEMAFLEFVDYKFEDKSKLTEKQAAADKKSAGKAESQLKRARSKELAAHRKSVRKIQNKSRAESRA